MGPGHLELAESEFSRRLVPRGRILGDPEYYIWGCSPIYGANGQVHVFYSRWPAESGWSAYDHDCEVAHAVADSPEGPYEPADVPVALSKSFGDGHWDHMSIHNPEVRRFGDRYAMLYYGSGLNGGCIRGALGLAFADSLDGPWTRHPDNPVVERGDRDAWDSVALNTPTFFEHPDGRVFLYYRSWTGRETDIRNDKIGVAIAEDVEGPYIKYTDNPVLDPTTIELSSVTPAAARQVGLEDPFVFVKDDTVYILARDFGLSGGRGGTPGKGLLFASEDGLNFSHTPEVAYHEATHYYDDIGKERLPDKLARRYGRFERPKLLIDESAPTHLFNAIVGGDHNLSTGHVFELEG